MSILFFHLKIRNNSKCTTAVREKLGYTCINHPLPGLVHTFCIQRFEHIFKLTVVGEGLYLVLSTNAHASPLN